MAARVLEVDAAAAVVPVDLAFLLLARVGPVLDAAAAHAAEDLVELLLAHEERVVLHLDFHAFGVEERERHFVCDLHVEERAEGNRFFQCEDFGEEARRRARVAGVDDGVVQLDGHEIG
jgi:hypothetical protein